MMPETYYALFYDVVDQFKQRRAPFRGEHLRLVREAHSEGSLLIAGALGEPPSGALLVFRASSPDIAEQFARHDPYVLRGLVTNWSVRPWHVVVEPLRHS